MPKTASGFSGSSGSSIQSNSDCTNLSVSSGLSRLPMWSSLTQKTHGAVAAVQEMLDLDPVGRHVAHQVGLREVRHPELAVRIGPVLHFHASASLAETLLNAHNKCDMNAALPAANSKPLMR